MLWSLSSIHLGILRRVAASHTSKTRTNNLSQTRYDYFTAPSGVPSINNEEDAAISAEACLPALESKLDDYNAFLICCYSQHPLVSRLRDLLAKEGKPRTLVTGIFEASVATCLQLTTPSKEKFGIVSTGKQWEDILDEAVADVLGAESSPRYAGTETTGLNADELHVVPKADLDALMSEATKRVLGKGARAVCLGCAGMAGMEEVVGAASVELLGREEGGQVRVVDGVVSGVAFLEGALRTNL